MARDLEKLHEQALERFKTTAGIEKKQRGRELEDLRFADPIEPEDQWPADALRTRAGLPAQGSLPPVPPRPALTINKLRQPLQQVQNAQRQARLSLDFSPEGNGADEDTAEAFEDIARAIQTDSRAQLARNWAFDRALRCGRGFYRIETQYVNDRSFDQELVYKRIKNQFAVYFYPFCQEPDYSDAEWCFITQSMPLSVYRRKYGESKLAAMTDQEIGTLENLTAVGDDLPGWTAETTEGRVVRVAEYYFFEEEDAQLVAVEGPDGPEDEPQGVLEEDLTPEHRLIADAQGNPQTRPVKVKRLRWAIMNGVEFLHEPGQEPIVERDGRYIPVVPVVADESNVNGDTRYTGLVRPAIEAQRLFNIEVSSLAEAVHLGPVSPYVGYASQFAGFESWWAQMNTRRFPYLPVNPPKNPNEAALPVPQRNTAEQPIQAIVVSLEQADAYIKAVTGIFDPSLGNVSSSDRSGRAIMALQKQGELSTSGYVDNLANMSLMLEGKIIRDLIPKVYDRPGRMVVAQGDDDTRRPLILGKPFIKQQGKPQVVGSDHPNAQIIDLAKGEYRVVPAVGKSVSTKREAGVASMGDLAQAAPQLVPAFADLWVRNMDFPGARQIADRLEHAVPQQFKGDDGQAPVPPQVQQQMAMAQKMVQELTAHVEQLSEVIKTKQIEHQAKIQIANIQADKDMALQVMRDATTIAAAHIAANAKGASLDAHAAEEAQALGQDAHQAALDRTHEMVMQQVDHLNTLDAQQQAHEQALEQGEQAHDQSLEAGQQDADNAMAAQAQQAELQPPQPGAGA